MFDLFGRRRPLLLALLSTILLTYWLPHTAPNFTLLCIVRTTLGLCNTVLTGSPLIADYIKNQSRGKAVAFSTMGMLFGEVFSMIVLVHLTAGNPVETTYTFAAAVLSALFIVPLCCLREPTL